MKIKIGKLIGKAARYVAENPGQVKIAAAVIGVTLPTVAVKGLDIAERVKNR